MIDFEQLGRELDAEMGILVEEPINQNGPEQECDENGNPAEELHEENMGVRITIDELLSFVPTEDSKSVLGNRFLCEGGSCVLVAQTSAGKSSLGMQMAVLFALGMDFFGLKPRRALRSIYVQAENDVGDTAEMLQGVLLGLGLVGEDAEANNDIKRRLEENLIIIRDQVHTGDGFAIYARKLVELHKPDLFWVDPMLSFFGDDINDQKAMSRFLRAKLNPISEATGIIWMMLHHTGKPSKDAAKTQKNWSSRDFSYMGIGSSELSNWARAIICLTATGEDEFRMIFAKRGWRAGLKEGQTPVTELNLAYSTDHICWRKIPKPKPDEEMESQFAGFAALCTTPMKATELVNFAANKLGRGARTIWKLWDSGEGPLGVLFQRDSSSLWSPKKESASTPYKDD